MTRENVLFMKKYLTTSTHPCWWWALKVSQQSISQHFPCQKKTFPIKFLAFYCQQLALSTPHEFNLKEIDLIYWQCRQWSMARWDSRDWIKRNCSLLPCHKSSIELSHTSHDVESIKIENPWKRGRQKE